MKINQVRIENFKSLKKIDIELSNLNLITGVNSSGKSSFIQAILLLKQNYQVMMNNILFGQEILSKISAKDNNLNTYYEEMPLNLDGDYVQIINNEEIFFEEAFDEPIKIVISSNEKQFRLEFTKDLNFNASGTNGFNIFKSDLQYIQTDRIAPQIGYKLSQKHINKNLIGIRGEYTAHYLAENIHKTVKEELRHKNSQTSHLLENVSLWLSEISEKIEIRTKVNKDLQQADLKYFYTYGDNTTNDYTPLNVGFGITYVLPIIVAILKAKVGDLLVIENPESHLHPKAQAKIAELCAIASSIGIQIILETHSDHILNGIRVATKKGILQSQQSKIYYFNKKQNDLETYIDKLTIDENGKINEEWPNGFFDEYENLLDELLW